MKTYFLDLWTRVVETVDRHVGTQKEVATLLAVSCTFIKKLLRQRWETGSLAPKPHGGTKWRSLMRSSERRCELIFCSDSRGRTPRW
jgi:hypothetical protein